MSDEVLPLLPLLMEPVVPVDGCMVDELVPPVPVVELPLPVVGALLPMVPGVVPMLPDELLLVWPLFMEPELVEPVPVPAPVVELLEPVEPVEPEVLPAPVTLGLVAVLGPVGAGMPGVAAPMPVLLGLSFIPEDWAWTMPVAAAAQTAAASRLLRMMLM